MIPASRPDTQSSVVEKGESGPGCSGHVIGPQSHRLVAIQPPSTHSQNSLEQQSPHTDTLTHTQNLCARDGLCGTLLKARHNAGMDPRDYSCMVTAGTRAFIVFAADGRGAWCTFGQGGVIAVSPSVQVELQPHRRINLPKCSSTFISETVPFDH